MRRRALLAGAATLGLAGPATAETWPSRPIKLVAPFAPGGGSDFTSRLVKSEPPPGAKGATSLIGLDGQVSAVAGPARPRVAAPASRARRRITARATARGSPVAARAAGRRACRFHR